MSQNNTASAEKALDGLYDSLEWVRFLRRSHTNFPWSLAVQSYDKALLEHCYNALTFEERQLISRWTLLPPIAELTESTPQPTLEAGGS